MKNYELNCNDDKKIVERSIPDRIELNGLISEIAICDLINYLLTDHDYFKNIYKSSTSIELPMGIDGREDNMHGISCGEINLKIVYFVIIRNTISI